MKRDLTQKRVVEREPFELPGGAKRERLTLECGHVIERAPRPQRPRRAYCLECPA
jgi:hypothetical protein